MNTFFRYSAVVSLLGLVMSCSASSRPSIDSSALDASTDAAFEYDARDSRDSETVIDGAEMNTVDTAVDAEGGEDGFLSIDFSSWILSEKCGPPTELEPLSEEPFEIPSRPVVQNPTPSRAEILADLGGPLPVGNRIAAAAHHQAGSDGLVYDIWAEFGDDVTLHATIFHGRPSDFDDINLNLWVTLDYEPVVATYSRWDADRETMREEVEATGLRRAVDQDVTSFDIVIPAERFEQPGAYEIGLGYEWSTFGGFKRGGSRRLVVYYGGFERHALKPCAPPVLDLQAADVERDMYLVYRFDDYILLLFDGMPDFRDVKPVVSPGQTIQFMASLYLASFDEPTPILAMPMLNGQPVGDAFMMSTGGAPTRSPHQAIDGRQSFEVTFPEEPGEYELLVATWVNPYEPHRYPDGTDNEDIEIGFLRNNSSSFTFVVEEK